MIQFAANQLNHLLIVYGYLAVLVFVAIESTGIPFPGETMLLTAAIYAGTTHHLAIGWVIAAAAAGAIIGDNLGYLVGREGGFRLLRRFGHLIHVNERHLKVGVYLFRREGGKVVFFGRFVTVLRAWAAFLAGMGRMPWQRFLAFNAAGGIVWATLYGLLGYAFGANVERFTTAVGRVVLVVIIVAVIAGIVLAWRREKQLEDVAERALPGPLDQYIGWRAANAHGGAASTATNGTTSANGASALPGRTVDGSGGTVDGGDGMAPSEGDAASITPPVPEGEARD